MGLCSNPTKVDTNVLNNGFPFDNYVYIDKLAPIYNQTL